MKHNLHVGWLLDGTNEKGDTYYFCLMYCDQCHLSGNTFRMSKELDDKPVISRKDYRFINDLPDECPAGGKALELWPTPD